ncbi:hypothetical protein ACVWW4_001675 [Bradyrhizobium sp. LB7.1]
MGDDVDLSNCIDECAPKLERIQNRADGKGRVLEDENLIVLVGSVQGGAKERLAVGGGLELDRSC